MKKYTEVVKSRYNTREKNIHIYDNQYALINPIGYYASLKIRNIFFKIFNNIRKNGVDITDLKMLDIGCGEGTWTRFFSELVSSTDNIYGMDLSEYRIGKAKNMNSKIQYFCGDIVNFEKGTAQYDFITAIDIFMHLNTEKQILKALENIKNLLTRDGYFIWYDAYSKNHFKASSEAESSGFNPKEMVNYCNQVGLKVEMKFSIFKKILWRYHSVYLLKIMPFWLIALLEKVLPGPPGNIVFIFRKNNLNLSDK